MMSFCHIIKMPRMSGIVKFTTSGAHNIDRFHSRELQRSHKKGLDNDQPRNQSKYSDVNFDRNLLTFHKVQMPLYDSRGGKTLSYLGILPPSARRAAHSRTNTTLDMRKVGTKHNGATPKIFPPEL
jgi:hypothetical protein